MMPRRLALFPGAVAWALLACAPTLPAAGPGPAAAGSKPPTEAPLATPPPATVEADLFTTSVKPALATSCAPCHVRGGKMYDRMPFDDPAVVRSHSEGILKRLKGESHEALARWIATTPP